MLSLRFAHGTRQVTRDVRAESPLDIEAFIVTVDLIWHEFCCAASAAFALATSQAPLQRNLHAHTLQPKALLGMSARNKGRSACKLSPLTGKVDKQQTKGVQQGPKTKNAVKAQRKPVNRAMQQDGRYGTSLLCSSS